jgi:quercetin dioxygenase-like cupin family protein
LVEHLATPAVVESAGNLPKRIEEFVGRASTGEAAVSIARMKSPAGWDEPAQRPDFDEYTLVLSGRLVVEHDGGRLEIGPGEAIHSRPGERCATAFRRVPSASQCASPRSRLRPCTRRLRLRCRPTRA